MNSEIPQIPDSATFFEHVGEQVLVLTDAEPMSITLERVKMLASQPGAPREEPFSLLFAVPEEWEFRQGILEMRNEGIGNLALFVTRTSPGYIEAIVN